MQTIDSNVPRVAPIEQPYPPEIQAVFDKIMPAGVPPLSLFTTLARVPRIYEKFRAGSLLDRGPLSMRHREIVIDRTCARCGCAYEWGVHVEFFAKRVGFTEEQIRATVDGGEFQGEEALLVRLVDELHDTSTISDALWAELSKAFSVEQIFECIALVGFYHTVSYFANGLKLRPEPFVGRAFSPRAGFPTGATQSGPDGPQAG